MAVQSSKLVGTTFKTKAGVEFTIMNTEDFSERGVSARYKDVLDFSPGVLVAVAYRTALIPNYVLPSGDVARIHQVKIGDKILNKPLAISRAIGIEQAMVAYEVTEVTK